MVTSENIIFNSKVDENIWEKYESLFKRFEQERYKKRSKLRVYSAYSTWGGGLRVGRTSSMHRHCLSLAPSSSDDHQQSQDSSASAITATHATSSNTTADFMLLATNNDSVNRHNHIICQRVLPTTLSENITIIKINKLYLFISQCWSILKFEYNTLWQFTSITFGLV